MSEIPRADPSERNASRDDGRKGSVPKGQAVNRIKHENPEVYLDIATAVQKETPRKILALLTLSHGGVTMDDVYNATTVSKRATRNHVAGLEDFGIIERTKHPTAISFANGDIEVLVSDLVSLVYEQP